MSTSQKTSDLCGLATIVFCRRSSALPKPSMTASPAWRKAPRRLLFDADGEAEILPECPPEPDPIPESLRDALAPESYYNQLKHEAEKTIVAQLWLICPVCEKMLYTSSWKWHSGHSCFTQDAVRAGFESHL